MAENNTQIRKMVRISKPRAKLIQRGESTHNHDQEITPVSLSTIKAIVRSPANPIPPDELERAELED